MPRLHTGAAIDRPETTNTTVSPSPEVVRQQPQETHLDGFHKNSTTETHKSTYTPDFKLKNDVETQALPIRETLPQVSGSGTETILEDQCESTTAHCLKDSKK